MVSDEKMRRLIEWNTDTLKRSLKDIIARRRAMGLPESNYTVPQKTFHTERQTVIDEVCEVIKLPHFDANAIATTASSDTIELSAAVETQLESYVSAIAAMYSNNPFRTSKKDSDETCKCCRVSIRSSHFLLSQLTDNFEHASHVTLSVVKLLGRVVAPSGLDFEDAKTAQTQLHDHTYGISTLVGPSARVASMKKTKKERSNPFLCTFPIPQRRTP